MVGRALLVWSPLLALTLALSLEADATHFLLLLPGLSWLLERQVAWCSAYRCSAKPLVCYPHQASLRWEGQLQRLVLPPISLPSCLIFVGANGAEKEQALLVFKDQCSLQTWSALSYIAKATELLLKRE